MLSRCKTLAALLALSASLEAKDFESSWQRDIKHVFVIVLENEGYDVTFGPSSAAPYLSKTLPSQGALLRQYYGTTHVSLGNYVAMLSGQSVNPTTQTDCQIYTDFVMTGVTSDGQAIGNGCIYPASVKSLPDQLKAAGKSWRGYMEDLGNDPKREPAACGNPTYGVQDVTQSAEAPTSSVPLGDQYAARHNPFVYFHSLLDSGECTKNVVNLTQPSQDLKSEATTPNFVFITPNLCHDGHDAPCKNGEAGGLTSADAFLKNWIPQIMASPAYKSGLIVVNFDEGGFSVAVDPTTKAVTISAPGAACCSEQPGPNVTTFPTTLNFGSVKIFSNGPGGDRTGAVLLSPFIKAGTVSDTPFNHYSLLKTLEDIFNVDGYLGYAGQPGLIGFFGCAASDVPLKTNQASHCESSPDRF